MKGGKTSWWMNSPHFDGPHAEEGQQVWADGERSPCAETPANRSASRHATASTACIVGAKSMSKRNFRVNEATKIEKKIEFGCSVSHSRQIREGWAYQVGARRQRMASWRYMSER